MHELEKWIENLGYSVKPIQLDGKYHRFHVDKPDGSGWYIGSTDLLPSGKTIYFITIGDHRTKRQDSYPEKGFKNFSPIIERAKKVYEEEQLKKQEVAQNAIPQILEKSTEDSHQYLKDKGFRDTKWKVYEGQLVVTVEDSKGNLTGIQFINEQGQKKFLTGTKKQGCFHILKGINQDALCVTEGFATGLSIREATGLTVYVAFDAGNLRPVCELLKKQKVIVCGDDDQWGETSKNIGRESAREAAKICGGQAIFPTFNEASLKTNGPTDFNDLHQLEGLEVVNEQITKTLQNHAASTQPGHENVDLETNEKFELTKKPSPYELSRAFLQDCGYLNGETTTLRYYRQDYFRYKDNYYQPVDLEWIKDKINRWLVARGFAKLAGTSSITQILENIQTRPIFIGAQVEEPCLVDEEIETTKNLIPLKNGLFDIAHYAKTNEIKIFPHTPNFFCRYILPYEFVENAECKIYDSFASEVFESEEYKLAWEEVMGIHLYSPFLIEKFFVLRGDGSNGKSVIRTILTALLGENNISSVGLECFNSQNFSFIQTLGKAANIIPDMHDISEINEGILKQFVSKEPMTFNRKFKESILATPTAYLTVCTNPDMKFTDKNEAIWRRYMLFEFPKEIPVEQQNPKLRDYKFWEPELPGIFNKALAGLMRVIKRGRIVEVKAMTEAVKKQRISQNFVAQFAHDCLKYETGTQRTTKLIYQTYANMVKIMGGKPLQANGFAAQLKKEAKKLGHCIETTEVVTRKDDDGKYHGRYWTGCLLNAVGEGYKVTESRDFSGGDWPPVMETISRC